MKKTFATTCLAGALWFLCAGCQDSVTVPIGTTPFVIHEQGLVFKFDPPLKQRRNVAGIYIALEGGWKVGPPWDAVAFADGRRAAIKAVLTSTGGKKYASEILGMAVRTTDGKQMLDIRFDLPGPKPELMQVEFFSDIPVQCNEAAWYDFQAK